MSCSPTGSPWWSNPHGTLIPGSPATLTGMVQTSDRYIARGSSIRAPILNATVGETGEAMTSTDAKALSKSALMSVLTCWALR